MNRKSHTFTENGVCLRWKISWIATIYFKISDLKLTSYVVTLLSSL